MCWIRISTTRMCSFIYCHSRDRQKWYSVYEQNAAKVNCSATANWQRPTWQTRCPESDGKRQSGRPSADELPANPETNYSFNSRHGCHFFNAIYWQFYLLKFNEAVGRFWFNLIASRGRWRSFSCKFTDDEKKSSEKNWWRARSGAKRGSSSTRCLYI